MVENNWTRRSPDVFIAGFPKCGTTTLHGMLAEHPSLVSAAVKEPALYSTKQNRDAGLAYARAILPVPDGRLVIDATPWYALVPAARRCLSEIAETKRIRVIVLLRDPLERALSMYADQVALGLERRKIDDALSMTKPMERITDQDQVRNHYIWGSRYDEHVPRLEEAVGRENLLVVPMEMLTSGAPQALTRIQDFLGISQLEVGLRRSNPATGPLPTWYRRLVTNRHLRRVSHLLGPRTRLILGESTAKIAKRGAKPALMATPPEEVLCAARVALESATAVHKAVTTSW